jgi:hypothetical protein
MAMPNTGWWARQTIGEASLATERNYERSTQAAHALQPLLVTPTHQFMAVCRRSGRKARVSTRAWKGVTCRRWGRAIHDRSPKGHTCHHHRFSWTAAGHQRQSSLTWAAPLWLLLRCHHASIACVSRQAPHLAGCLRRQHLGRCVRRVSPRPLLRPCRPGAPDGAVAQVSGGDERGEVGGQQGPGGGGLLAHPGGLQPFIK